MDEKRRQALLKAVKSLWAAGATDADIASSLGELGVTDDEASLLIREVKGVEAPKAEPQIVQSEPKISPREVAIAKDSTVWKESIENRIQEEKLKYSAAKELQEQDENMPEDEFPKHYIARGDGQEFIPQLKTGGKEKVKEIVLDSPIGKVSEEIEIPGAQDVKKIQTNAPKYSKPALKSGLSESEKLLIEKMEHLEGKIEELEKEVDKDIKGRKSKTVKPKIPQKDSGGE